MSTQNPFEPVRRPRARSMAAGVAALGLFAALSMTPVLAAPPGSAPGQDRCQEVGSNCQQQSPTPTPTPTPSPSPSPSEEPSQSPDPTPTPSESASPSDEPSPTPTPSESPDEPINDEDGALPGSVTPDPDPSDSAPTGREDVRGGNPEPVLPDLNASPVAPSEQLSALPDTSMAAGSDKLLSGFGVLLMAAALHSVTRRREATARI
jgi:hypothetical protein